MSQATLSEVVKELLGKEYHDIALRDITVLVGITTSVESFKIGTGKEGNGYVIEGDIHESYVVGLRAQQPHSKSRRPCALDH